MTGCPNPSRPALFTNPEGASCRWKTLAENILYKEYVWMKTEESTKEDLILCLTKTGNLGFVDNGCSYNLVTL